MRKVVMVAGAIGGLICGAHAVQAAGKCGAVFDRQSVLSKQARDSVNRMLAVQMYRKKMRGNTMFTSERCAAEKETIRLYQRDLSFMQSHPECYNASDLTVTQGIIKNDKEDLVFGCTKEKPGTK